MYRLASAQQSGVGLYQISGRLTLSEADAKVIRTDRNDMALNRTRNLTLWDRLNVQENFVVVARAK